MMAFVLQPNLIWATEGGSLVSAARIEGSSLSGVINGAVIQSFDLSPDGKTIAILAVAGSKVAAPLWLVIEDLSSKQVTASHELGPSTFGTGGFSSQVLYSSDQQYLVVQDLQTIRVFDSKNLTAIRTISAPSSTEALVPLFAMGAASKNIFVCAFGRQQKLDLTLHATPVRLEIVDVSSGTLIGDWASEDVPQSISSNGDFIAVSSWQKLRPVLPVNVFDTQGKKVAEITGDFAFKKVTDQSKPLGRVMGLFLDTQELLLTSDERVDQSGHLSGESLEIVTITGKQVQKLKPQHYASTGEMAISRDRKTTVAISWYAPARALAQEHAVLPASSPELLVFERGTSIRMDSSLPIHGLGLKASGWLENRRPRLSFDGSVIAIAQDNGITILTRKGAKSH
jgi:hypothetical protein